MAKEKNKNDKFFKNLKAQLKKVVWPTPKQLFTSTSTVITIVLVIALIVFVLDLCFESINKYGIYKVRDYVIEKFDDTSSDEEIEEITSQSEFSDGIEQDLTTEDSEDNLGLDVQTNIEAEENLE